MNNIYIIIYSLEYGVGVIFIKGKTEATTSHIFLLNFKTFSQIFKIFQKSLYTSYDYYIYSA